MDELIFFLKGSVFSVPFLLLQFIGLILSVVYRSRLPRVWGAAVVAFLLLLIGNISWLIYYGLYIWVFSKSKDYDTGNIVMLAQSWVQAITGFFGYLLLLIALFRRRDAQ